MEQQIAKDKPKRHYSLRLAFRNFTVPIQNFNLNRGLFMSAAIGVPRLAPLLRRLS